MNHETAVGRCAEILLVEDSHVDVLLTRETFERVKFKVNLHHVEHGEHCMAFLRKEPPYADAPTPDLILLDLNMPVMDGRQALAEIVKDDNLRHLPVVILSTSNDERDVLDMFKLRCSSYMTKPVDFDQFQKLIESLITYWFVLTVLPPRDDE